MKTSFQLFALGMLSLSLLSAAAPPPLYETLLNMSFGQGGVSSPDASAPVFGAIRNATGSTFLSLDGTSAATVGLTVAFDVDICSDLSCSYVRDSKHFSAVFVPAAGANAVTPNLSFGGSEFRLAHEGSVSMKNGLLPMPALQGNTLLSYLGPPAQPGQTPASVTSYEVDFTFTSYDFGWTPITIVVQLLP